MNQYAVLVSSEKRTSGSNVEFTTDIGSLGLGTSITGFKVAVQYVQFINTHYSINEKYSEIKFCEAIGPSTVLTATLAYANYTYSTIAAAVTTAMNAAPGGTYTYSTTIDTTTGKLTISAGGVNTFQLKYVAGGNSALERLGFTSVGLDLGLAITYTSNGIVDLAGPKMMHIDISELGHYGINNQVNTAFVSFPLSALFGVVESYHPHFLVWNPIQLRQLNRLSVRVLDDKGKLFSSSENTDFVIQFLFIPIE